MFNADRNELFGKDSTQNRNLVIDFASSRELSLVIVGQSLDLEKIACKAR